MSNPNSIGANHAGTQRIVNVRQVLGGDVIAPEHFDLTPEDVRLLLHIRAVGYGEIRVTVNKGKPAKCMLAESNIDYTKPISFE